MPVVHNDIELRSIARKHLSHENESKGGGISTSGNIPTQPIIQCAENIPLGSAIFIHTNGLAYFSGLDIANAFALDSGEEGDYIRYSNTGIIYNPDADFDVGKEVWLVYDDPNIMTDNPDLSPGIPIQKLGKAIENHKFLAHIEEVFTIES